MFSTRIANGHDLSTHPFVFMFHVLRVALGLYVLSYASFRSLAGYQTVLVGQMDFPEKTGKKANVFDKTDDTLINRGGSQGGLHGWCCRQGRNGNLTVESPLKGSTHLLGALKDDRANTASGCMRIGEFQLVPAYYEGTLLFGSVPIRKRSALDMK